MRGTYVPPMTAVPARVRLSDGTNLAGKLVVRSAKPLAETLNSATLFVEFESSSGEHSFLTKSQIVSVTLLEIPKAANLLGATGADDFDPHALLGIERGATADAIRQAYLRTTKKYHPDRFASIELPEEVEQYLGAMARRINAAYALLESEFEAMSQ